VFNPSKGLNVDKGTFHKWGRRTPHGPFGPYPIRGVKPVPLGVDDTGEVRALSDDEVVYRNGVLAIWSASDLDQAPTPADAVDQWLDRAMTDDADRPLGGSW
jgi:hypothetical protein